MRRLQLIFTFSLSNTIAYLLVVISLQRVLPGPCFCYKTVSFINFHIYGYHFSLEQREAVIKDVSKFIYTYIGFPYELQEQSTIVFGCNLAIPRYSRDWDPHQELVGRSWSLVNSEDGYEFRLYRWD
jgi:hypothetical protein